jgi:arylformamidase
MQYIDLSVPINASMPVYPGDPPTKVERAGVFEKDGWNDHYVSMGTHAGTHIDAPMHMVPGGKSLDQFALDRFVGRGRLVVLKDRQYDLEALQQIDIQSGDIVLFYSGVSDVYPDPSYLESYPAMPQPVAQYLADKQVSMVGVDMSSVDHEAFIAHTILLKNDILIIENLTNLRRLEGREFTVYALPIKLQVDGAPARVIAQIL